MKAEYAALEQQLKSPLAGQTSATNGVCTLELCNRTPSNWDVTIVEAGVVFAYSGGGTFNDGPYTINLRTGNCFTFRSNDPTRCVNEVFLSTKVRAGNEERLLNHIETAKPGECFIHIPVSLGPKSSIAESDLSSTEPRVELKSM
jgi:hypothetical protein